MRDENGVEEMASSEPVVMELASLVGGVTQLLTSSDQGQQKRTAKLEPHPH